MYTRPTHCRYYWAGAKLYDVLAGAENIESSYFLTKSKALDAFPMLNKDHLFGAIVYYGQSPHLADLFRSRR